MKALSLHGNYIMDIINGNKTIEYRTWKTNYRGPILLCASAKKYGHAVHGYAICVVKVEDITWNDDFEEYEWHLAPFEDGGSYLIEPIPIKGQLRLFNIDDNLIKKAPFIKVNHNDSKFEKWYQDKIESII